MNPDDDIVYRGDVVAPRPGWYLIRNGRPDQYLGDGDQKPTLFEDEFGPYLEDAMRDEEFARAYEYAQREPTEFERTLERSAWARFYWRYLRSFDALVDRVRFDLMFARPRAGESIPPAGIDRLGEAVAIAENWKGRVPW